VYAMGDGTTGAGLRRIVARAGARTGRMMVREAEQGITGHVTRMLDTDRGHHSRGGEGLSESFEAGIRVAASLGVRHLREGYELRTETNGGPLARPIRGAGKQRILPHHLARVGQARAPPSALTPPLGARSDRSAPNIV